MNETTKTITVNRRLRPIRLAFLIEPKDKQTLRKILQINTCLWGGRFNAIIPVYKRTPKSWGDKYIRPPAAKEVLSGYIDAFEPDYLVVPNSEYKIRPQFPEDRVITLKDILDPSADNPIGFGIDVIELFSYLYEKEFQFVRRHPHEVILLKSKYRQMDIFKAACFGEFPKARELAYLVNGYKDAFDAKEMDLNESNLFQFFKTNKFTPLRLACDGISVHDRGWSLGPSLFYMDGTSPLDLIDYWNLRAAGYRIVPLPSQWAPNLVDDCTDFITQNHRPYRHNKEMMHMTTMICSRSSKFEDVQNYAKTLKTPRGALSCQHWYPRIWDEWARDKDHVVRANVTYKEGDIDVQSSNHRINFPDISPAFVERFGGRSTPRWVNVIQLSDYSHSPDFAAVIPPNTPDLDKILETLDRNGVWSTSEGIIIPSQHFKWTHRWNLPTATEIFSGWMTAKGFQFQTSSAGNITSQIVRCLGGSWGISAIADDEIIYLLNKMASGSTVNIKQWMGLLKKTSRNHATIAQRRLKHLLAHKVLQLGLRIQCCYCSQHTWYSLDAVRETLTCEKCLQSFDFPVDAPPKDSWHYRTIGPFSVPNFAQGGYCVAIVLRFFSHTLHSEVSWMPSFTLQGKDIQLESDFGVFWQQSKYQRSEPILILGECKTYDRFEKKDIDRARKLAEIFPGAVFAFCTLRKELDAPEKKKIAAFAKRGRRYWKSEKWYNPVLVLTGIELFSDFGPPHCWKDAGGKYSTHGESYHGYNDIQELCDATQQLHLDMEPYWTWYHKKVEKQKRRRNMIAKQKTST